MKRYEFLILALVFLIPTLSYAEFYERITAYSDYYCATTVEGKHSVVKKVAKGYKAQDRKALLKSRSEALSRHRKQRQILNGLLNALNQNKLDNKKTASMMEFIRNLPKYFTEGIATLPESVKLLKELEKKENEQKGSGFRTDEDKRIAIENLQKLNDISLLGIQLEIKAIKNCYSGKLIPEIGVAGELHAIRLPIKGNFIIVSAIKIPTPFKMKGKNRLKKGLYMCVRSAKSTSEDGYKAIFAFNPCYFNSAEGVTNCSSELQVANDQIASYDSHIYYSGFSSDTEEEIQAAIQRNLIEATAKYLTSYSVRPLRSLKDDCKPF